MYFVRKSWSLNNNVYELQFLKGMWQILEFAFQFIVEFLIIGILADHQSDRSSFHAHGDTEILSAWCEAVHDVFFLANSWQMTHDVDGINVSGKNCDSSFSFTNSCLDVLQAIDDVLCSLFRCLLDELVDFLSQFLGGHWLRDGIYERQLFFCKTWEVLFTFYNHQKFALNLTVVLFRLDLDFSLLFCHDSD
jgi:hypothetical protein